MTRHVMSSRTCGFALMLACGVAGGVRAQSFSIEWFTISSGGGTCGAAPFDLSATTGQFAGADLSGGRFTLQGGFWPGALSNACAGTERLAKATCKEHHGANRLTVVLAHGVPGDAFAVTLTDGDRFTGTLNSRGKGKAKFNNRPPGDSGLASAEWGCGTTDERGYTCP